MKTHPVIDQLEPEALDPDQIVSGSPEVTELTLIEAENGQTSGLWQITPGVVTDTEVEESFLVLSGRGRITFEDGSELKLSPGIAHRFQGGEKTTWTIEETLLKTYWIK